jgi:hypothetical protein
MKKWILLVIAVLIIASLAGCSSDNGGTDNNTNGNGDGNGTETAQWAAYAFGDTVNPSSGGSGKIKTFTIDSKTTENGKVREFKIEGTYLGKETAQIVTQKMIINTSSYSSTTENVSTSMECYKVIHRVTVVRDDTGDTHPAWADITLWIPTSDLETTTSYFWIYPKATYVDSDGHEGEMSYYLTEAMLNEMANPPAGTSVSYLPTSEGDFYGYDEYAFFGLYGYGWIWFQAFAEGGQQHLEVGSWNIGTYKYTCAKVNKTIGGYTFHAWSVDWSVTTGGSSGGWTAIFSPDLALPIYSKFGGTGEGSSNSFEYTLTDLELG